MPRKPRIYLPGVPAHVVQRGNNRDACFHVDDDFHAYKDWLGDACRRYGVELHAYVLMTNHVHLLMTPRDQVGISLVMQSVGRRYVQYVNRTYQRSGTLWESRHKASVIDAEAYLLACGRYVELNPVRAGMVEHPADYAWSSYRRNAYGAADALVSPHALYLSLGHGDERLAVYRDLFRSALAPDQVQAIRRATHFSMPLGNDRFRLQVETAVGHALGHSARGRPARRSGTGE